MRLPDFIAVGPQRTGTTWLYEVLREHVGLSKRVKEIQFFKWHFEKGLSWYASHFTECPPGLPIGEICPVYFNSPLARSRMASTLPRCKIICSFRDPVDRAYSHYRMLRPFAGLRSFEESLATLPDLIDCSRYARHLRDWRESFGAANVLVVLHEDLEADPQRFVNSICSFLGVVPIDLAASSVAWRRINLRPQAPRSRILGIAANRLFFWLRSHRYYTILNAWEDSRLWSLCFSGGERYTPINPETEQRLRETFTPEIEQLEKLIGRDLSAWKLCRISRSLPSRDARPSPADASPYS